ncbi:peroxisomal acyl-coenzyme A oxidase 1-like isoform X2 [Corticium candelabrum]|nr:peroxisomal acyl-coenzyme A oxidase 1-like isoform X2 [Corticium candelabrum]
MFQPAIQSLGTDEQIAKWMPLARNYRLLGTYAQTELGHGTYLRGLETTATYDPKSQEFVLHSPTLTSIKWWPGGLGKSSTHAVVMARLIARGRDHGIHPFIVQLRSLEDHVPLEGITVGDIGPKMGYATSDNGFLQLTNVRIPRDQMLMRYSQVAPDGTYSRLAGGEKLMYGTMLTVRCYLIRYSAIGLSMALTTAVRYSVVRRQTSPAKGLPEMQLLDYQVQQYRLLSLLSAAYCFAMLSNYMLDSYQKAVDKMGKGDFSALPELHATSAGLKAFCTTITSDGIETCRKCCGGHGYSKASGLPTLYADFTPSQTYEGDNTVLYLQTARFLIKCCMQAQVGEELPDNLTYLKDSGGLLQRDWLKSDVQLKLYGQRAKHTTLQTALRLQSLIDAGQPQHEAWNACSVQLIASSRAHCYYVAVKTFIDSVAKLQDTGDFGVFRVLKLLCDLFALHGVLEFAGDFLECGTVTSTDLAAIRLQVFNLLSTLRCDAVALVDAFDIPDKILCSVLGRYDGDVYKHFYEWAKKSPLNKKEVIDGYHTYLKPIFRGEVAQSKL